MSAILPGESRAGDISFDILNNVNLGAFVLDRELKIIFWNSVMENWTAMPSTTVVGNKITGIYPHLNHTKYLARLDGVFLFKTPAVFSSLLHKYFIPVMQKGGEPRAQLTTVTPVVKQSGEILALVTVQDVTELNDRINAFREMRDKAIKEIEERKKLEDRLRYDATHDLLTNLLNHHNFVDTLDTAVSLAKRHGHPLSVCLWDLDHFKTINDTYGHQIGDMVLIKFAELLKMGIRHEDTAGRYGGEEFGVVLQHTKASGTAQSMERILEKFRSNAFTSADGASFHATATCGVAELDVKLNDPQKILRAADIALYHGKNTGRNIIVIYTPEMRY